MTESCSCLTAHSVEVATYDYAHTVGVIVPSTTIKIIREDGSECQPGEPGEICGKGPQVVMGYLNNPKATTETFDSEGYLHTGDQGSIDAKTGLVTITDRIKEMIKVKGIQVAPAELEDFLLGHEAVEDVAVLGIADEWSGEVPKAFVVPKPGFDIDSPVKTEKIGRELLRYVREHKVRHKHIKEIEFIEAIPKSGSGKILRRILRDQKRDETKIVREIAKERARL